jgi:hypothetical protein
MVWYLVKHRDNFTCHLTTLCLMYGACPPDVKLYLQRLASARRYLNIYTDLILILYSSAIRYLENDTFSDLPKKLPGSLISPFTVSGLKEQSTDLQLTDKIKTVTFHVTKQDSQCVVRGTLHYTKKQFPTKCLCTSHNFLKYLLRQFHPP